MKLKGHDRYLFICLVLIIRSYVVMFSWLLKLEKQTLVLLNKHIVLQREFQVFLTLGKSAGEAH